jgi:hypothetical protein
VLTLPYAKVPGGDSSDFRVVDVYVDEEIACEGFTYRLATGEEDTIPSCAALDHNRDPAYLRDLRLHMLTCEALDRIDTCGMSRREIARRLNTSLSQLYRMLDTTNYSKTIDSMLALLTVLGCDVDIEVVDRSA